MIRAPLFLLMSAILSGCAFLAPLPEPTDLETRLSQFPTEGLDLEGPVSVRWNSHQVPYIEASTDRDLAYTLGLVHGHLRLGQIALFRRATQGRLAESVGPIAVDIDHGLRTLDLGRAVPEMERALPAETRTWVRAFVAGLNRAQDHAVALDALPAEYRILALEPEPFTVADILTIGRLVSVDVNWIRYINMLPLRERPDWPSLWARFLDAGADALPSYDPDAKDGVRLLTDLLVGNSRSGSNSFVVQGDRSASGGALIANDPHLGIFAPNTWLLAGIKSPGHHAVGMMPPGLPIIGVGRNPDISWGGTNMQSANSDLVDVSGLPADAFTAREEAIKVRWWFDTSVEIRETAHGPVLSDLPLIQTSDTLSLRWIGHRPSDELTAWLRAGQARDWEEFRAAFADYAVAPLAIVYADRRGHVGLLTGTTLPRRPNTRPADLVVAPGEGGDWSDLLTPKDLPALFDPPAGFIASANNPPAPADVPIGYFFAPSDRIDRLNAVLSDRSSDPMTAEDLKRLQADTYSRRNLDLVRLLLVKAAEARSAGWTPEEDEERVLALLGDWDGRYEANSAEALAAEATQVSFLEAFFSDAEREEINALRRPREAARPYIARADAQSMTLPLEVALKDAIDALEEFETWGGMHRLRLGHPLANVPLIGGRFVYLDEPVGGTSETVMKTAHSATLDRHRTRYGSNARHVSDMGDLDANDFVLLGGQDGAINSETAIDQVELWQQRRYIRMPLSPARVVEAFPILTSLRPDE